MKHKYSPKEIEQLCIPKFEFILGYGYEYAGVSQAYDDLMGHSCKVSWKKKSVSRAINIEYFEAGDTSPMGTLVIEIENLSPPELDEYDHTSLTTRDADIPRLGDIDGAFRERVESCLSKAIMQFEGELKEMLLGNEWEPSHIDWQSFK